MGLVALGGGVALIIARRPVWALFFLILAVSLA
jgi:hypothetical protein